jgi:hypothetical protein
MSEQPHHQHEVNGQETVSRDRVYSYSAFGFGLWLAIGGLAYSDTFLSSDWMLVITVPTSFVVVAALIEASCRANRIWPGGEAQTFATTAGFSHAVRASTLVPLQPMQRGLPEYPFKNNQTDLEALQYTFLATGWTNNHCRIFWMIAGAWFGLALEMTTGIFARMHDSWSKSG